MIGKRFNAFKVSVSNNLANIQSTKIHEVNAPQAKDPSLPLAPKSAFRKRPVKLEYDPNEYHMFRLPSESESLFSGMDRDDIFGYRKGLQHSPFMKAQQDLDSNILWLVGIGTVCASVVAMRQISNLRTLRENYRLADHGRFTQHHFV